MVQYCSHEGVAISEFKAKCLSLLEQVQNTKEPIRITRFGKPVAEVVPPSPETHSADWIGSMTDSMKIVGDIVSRASDESDREALRELSFSSRCTFVEVHIWLWSLQDPTRLGKRVRHELRNPENELWLSPSSTWEALTLNTKSKIRLPAHLTQGWRKLLLPYGKHL